MKNILSCPAKILLAGGYAILHPTNHGLSIAIDARFYSIMRKYQSDNHQLIVSSPQFNQQYFYDLHKYGQNENKNNFIDGVVTVLRRNPDLHDINYSYELTLMADNAYYGQTDKAMGKKSGLGSSAGVIVSSLAQFTRVTERLLDLSKQANFLAQNKVGSGFDLSTAIFGSQLFSQQSIKPIVLAEDMKILLVDLQQGSNTVQGVNTVQKYLNQNDSIYIRFLQESEQTVQSLLSLLSKPNIERIEIKKINDQYRKLLKEIGNQSNFHIEPQIASTILDFISQLDCTLWSICPGAGGYDAMAFLVQNITETQINEIREYLKRSNISCSFKLFNLAKDGQTRGQTTVQIIVPTRAQLIFDVNQAYSAYSLPKIHYKQQYSELPNVQKRPSKHEQLDTENDNHKSKGDNNIFKEWNVNYQEDIQKRLASHKSLKQQENSVLLDSLKSIAHGPPNKKSRLHRTKFKINKTNKNHPIIENTICQYINQNIQFKPDKNTSQKDYDNNAPFFIPSLAFAEELNEEKQHFKQKYGFDDKTLRKNKLILEEVVLLRLQKREKIREKNKLVNQIT